MATKRDRKKDAAVVSAPLPSSYRGWTVLPCNGLDKEAGALAREMALAIASKGAKLICPVRYGRSPDHYRKELGGSHLLVINGCKKECADGLARERGLKAAAKLNVKESLREFGLKSGKQPVPGAKNLRVLLSLLEGTGKRDERAVGPPPSKPASAPAAEGGGTDAVHSSGLFMGAVELREFMADKFVFKVPAAGYLFNENDCWARVEGTRARLGVSDYVQQSASDMVFFEPPAVGAEIIQFDEAGSLESTKTALDIISPVSGRVVAINDELVEAPELINQDPYVRGWAVEVELSNLAGDRELLMDCDGYFAYLQGKVERELREKASGVPGAGEGDPRPPAGEPPPGRAYELGAAGEDIPQLRPAPPPEPGEPWKG